MSRFFALRTLLFVALVASCGDDDVVPPADGGDAGRDASPSDGAPADTGDFDAGECPDEDGDGVGALPCGTDCDDTDAARYPGATELCDYAGHDEDCNDTTYGTKDDDGDGYSDVRCCNTAAAGAAVCGLDCDDTRGGAHPGLPEVCNRRDDDCNGVIDEDSQVDGFADLDRDLYGDDASPIMACAGTGGISVNSTDCDDSSITAGRASPAFAEVAGDGIDNNCNGVVDESGGPTALWYRDSDGDGFGDAADTATSSTVLPGYALLGGDCDDANAARSPVAAELCNGVDDDCNGRLDYVVAINDWEDDDGDGSLDVTCGGAATDCDDGDRSTYVGAAEVCDGRDNDCDGTIDEACTAPMDGGVPLDAGMADLGPPDLGSPDAGPPARVPAYLKASNTGSGDYFGYALALSADGTRLAVGARTEGSAATGVGGDQLSNAALNSGAVYVYFWSGTAWAQEAYIKASNTEAGDNFGWSVSLSGDGSRLAVGAYNEDSSAPGIDGNQADNGAPNSGAVYVFARTGTAWAQEAYVKASNPGANDWFGSRVALAADGSRLAVGAPQEASSARGIGGNQADNSLATSGAAYVFLRAGTNWAQEAYVKASNTGMADNFGSCVSLSDDGSRLAVSAYIEDSAAVGIDGDQLSNAALDAGAVYLFSRAGVTWTQESYIKASNTGPDDRFGTLVSLAGDGTRLAVGAYREDSAALGVGGDQLDDTSSSAGAVYVFLRAGIVWTQEAYLKASNTGMDDRFGIAVSLSQDGSRLAVGAYTEDSRATGIDGDQANGDFLSSGAAYEFSRTGTAWTQAAYVKASNTGADDQFGWTLALSADGTRLAVSGHQEDSSATGVGGDQSNNSLADSGAVYVY